MWHKAYKDYPTDAPLKKEQVETGKGIVGCEMHDMFGWGLAQHKLPKKKQRGFIATLLSSLFKS